MRGLAVLLMIAVHTTDAFLAEIYKDGWIWHQIHILYGFVAPAFIFFSGVTFRIALERRSVASRSTRDLLLRSVVVITIGYWLQIPSHSLHITLHSTPEQINRFLDCNVLQLIGAMMLMTIGLYSMFRTIDRTVISSLFLCLVVVLFTPYTSRILASSDIPSVISPWLLPKGSFPFLPYGAYFLSGFGIVGFMRKYSLQLHGGFWIVGSGILLLWEARS